MSLNFWHGLPAPSLRLTSRLRSRLRTKSGRWPCALASLLALAACGNESSSAPSGAAGAAGASGEAGAANAAGASGAAGASSVQACAAHWGGAGAEECMRCGCGDAAWSCAVSTCMSPRRVVEQLGFEAGFFELESVDTTLSGRAQRSAATRLWYSFQPADAEPERKPLVVLFNGGPGSATSSILFSYQTGANTLRPDATSQLAVAPNPHSWTRFANLLYVDARQTGFSYSVSAPPAGEAFDAFGDAADFVRLLLRFLARHPGLQRQPVVLAGESYGGVRAVLMRYYLQNPGRLAGDFRYHDTALAAEIGEHLQTAFDRIDPAALTPATIARQFGYQALIQPVVSLEQLVRQSALFTSPNPALCGLWQGLATVPAECSSTNPLCLPAFTCAAGPVDRYNIAKPDGYVGGAIAAAGSALQRTSVLQAMLGVDPRDIGFLGPAARAQAFRTTGATAPPAPTGTDALATDLGALATGDAYFITNNEAVAAAINPTLGDESDLWLLPLFEASLLHGHTFLTNAVYDTSVYTPAIADVLARPAGPFERVEAIAPPDGARAGGFRAYVRAAWPGGPYPGPVEVTMPSYPTSGHTVSLDQPAELAEDIERWLGAALAPPPGP
jgi:Serine carboxypeptidase